MDNIISIEEQDFTLIGKNCRLEGVFKFTGATHLAGYLEGEVHLKDNSPLTIESTAKINGKVFCENIKVFGKIEGEIFATGLVEIFPTGNIKGLINSKNFIVHPGAIINIDGHSTGL
ncbi:hypothetical protein A9Q84_11925 [Halobacteriovorax marinus]|uniref:Polymer-forming cytoskeletal protein n=1 Tax=Halobacteriovorax marinus TaxID=97084 RepID=A0A1Y5F8B8_9BACT|nr:hypothetical protein A9Q84_11925 [Halobacteriovorax marinus]